MPDKKRSSSGKSKAFYSLLLLIPNLFRVINNMTRLIKQDAYLAGRSVVLIITLAVMLACLLTSTWLGILAVIFVCLIKLKWSWIIATTIVFLLNFLLLLVIGMVISKAKENLSFPATRRQLCRKKACHDDD
jgi:hypothetical protein